MNRLIFFLCLLIGIFGGLRKDANAFTNKLKEDQNIENEQEEEIDLIFIIDEREINTNQKYFKGVESLMDKASARGGMKVITITEWSYEAFKQFILFMESGNVDLDIDIIIDIKDIATKYNIEDLRILIKRYIADGTPIFEIYKEIEKSRNTLNKLEDQNIENEQEEEIDLIFIIDEREINTNQKYFKGVESLMDKASARGGMKVITITEWSYEAFKQFILFMESGNVDLDIDIIIDIKDIATKYNIEDLRILIKRYIADGTPIFEIYKEIEKSRNTLNKLSIEINNIKSLTKEIDFNLLNDLIEEESQTREREREQQDTYSQGIHHQTPLSHIQASKFEKVYDEPYSHPSTMEELLNIEATCTQRTILCVAAYEVGATHIQLMACGYCKYVLHATTDMNNGVLHRGVYWYLLDDRSFGFSNIGNIQLESFISDRMQGEERLSWRLKGDYGGFRVGNSMELYDSEVWKKQIYIY